MELVNMNAKYPGGKQLFRHFHLSIQQREKVLIIGPSGCGKSTLLQILCGLIPNVLDVPLLAEKHEVPDSWGYVFQDPDTQFCMPYVDEELAFVLENLAVPRENMRARMMDLLEMVGLQGLNLRTKIQELSGGMKQRLAIASVLAMEPDVLFLDEPTALLDPVGTMEVWDILKKVCRDKTVIIVEHKIEQLEGFSDRVIVLNEEGQIMADATPADVFQQERPLLKKYGVWYPGAWRDYLSERGTPLNNDSSPEVVLHATDFSGFRGRERKITVPEVTVSKGEWIAITGENGAGKSTLLESFMKLLKTRGDLLLDGKKVKDVPSDVMTFVFQNPEHQFVTKSVEEEIGYTLLQKKFSQEDIRLRIDELLSLFQLEHVRKQHPYQLSMGQKRRLSVAAAVVHRPKILLLDEPTFGQDSKNTFRMLEWLEKLRQEGVAILMVTHDEQIVSSFANTVWSIQDGRLVEIIENNRRSKSHAVGAI
ncbi:Putative HMP/thiamine import ATP-binding protein YkoD [Bacillus sp. THAF10]|uniref:ABC transporter ATP-binding protein n=1 Tax=Bacillus sp. THAF10 TaxID=2587848 RepID=UPI001269759D|nr:ATP-binding cassette domain-containing protein [Bacillus sp. THAF10]QFT88216.1 Putative HMP/thiamine import ATP-binding protein YkoD [Bacillus sp. THAF10]